MSDYPNLDLEYRVETLPSVDGDATRIEERLLTEIFNSKPIIHRIGAQGAVAGYNQPVVLKIAKRSGASYTSFKTVMVTFRFRRIRHKGLPHHAL